MKFLASTKLYICTGGLLLSSSLYAGNPTQIPEPLPITEQRNAAVGYALSFSSVVVNVTNKCKMIPALSKSPIDAFTSWHLRNKQYFEAAQGWVHYVGTQVKAIRGQAAAVEFESRIVGDAAQTGESTVKGFFSRTPPSEVCERWIGLLFNSQSDLINDKSEFNNELQDIVKFHKAVTEWHALR